MKMAEKFGIPVLTAYRYSGAYRTRSRGTGQGEYQKHF
jgi:acetyl-CoA carboxylase alpha subunit